MTLPDSGKLRELLALKDEEEAAIEAEDWECVRQIGEQVDQDEVPSWRALAARVLAQDERIAELEEALRAIEQASHNTRSAHGHFGYIARAVLDREPDA